MSSRSPGPLGQIALGVAIGLAAFGLPVACAGTLPPVVRCKLHALEVLPKDPAMVTPYDAVDIWHRVRDCERGSPDGGPE